MGRRFLRYEIWAGGLRYRVRNGVCFVFEVEFGLGRELELELSLNSALEKKNVASAVSCYVCRSPFVVVTSLYRFRSSPTRLAKHAIYICS